ncbi:MAG: hypothetical protein R3315_04635 [Woeseiaceae bacterium]|nr:hypothetical protein [Woeseiaceae bacterium]
MNRALPGILLLLSIAVPALAQDTESPDLAVDEQADSAGVDEAEQARAAEIDELEPGVPSQMLASDVRRSSVDGGVMDELDLGATEVTGNQELPKVLYIVPWRKSDPGDLMGRPANTLLDEVLEPVDRREFVREVDYYSDLFEDEDE